MSSGLTFRPRGGESDQDCLRRPKTKYETGRTPAELMIATAAAQPQQAEHRPADRAGQDRLRQMQYQPACSDGLLAKTGLRPA